LLRRHGYELRADTTIKTIKAALANYPGVTFTDFLAFDRQFSTGNQFRNPGGYYRDLARKCGRHFEEQRASVRMSAVSAASGATTDTTAGNAADIPRDDKRRCAKCGGGGTLKGGGYCDVCPTGKDLSRIANRKTKPKSETTRVDFRAV
jgi:hypothetical protein